MTDITMKQNTNNGQYICQHCKQHFTSAIDWKIHEVYHFIHQKCIAPDVMRKNGCCLGSDLASGLERACIIAHKENIPDKLLEADSFMPMMSHSSSQSAAELELCISDSSSDYSEFIPDQCVTISERSTLKYFSYLNTEEKNELNRPQNVIPSSKESTNGTCLSVWCIHIVYLTSALCCDAACKSFTAYCTNCFTVSELCYCEHKK